MNRNDDQVIAIVNDDDSVCRSLRGLLASMRYRVKTFGSAEAYLLSASRAGTACLVLDLQLSGMGGLGLLDAQAAGHRQVPTIVLTDEAGDETRERCRLAGVMAFFRKPCNPHILGATVRAATGRPMRSSGLRIAIV
jgi:FixJ family two-component response regulator